MDLEQALQEIDRLKGDLAKFDGINPTEVQRQSQTLTEQLAATRQELNQLKQTSTQTIADLQTQLTQKDVGMQFNNALSQAGVLPQYRNLLDNVAGSLKLENGKLVSQDGKPFDAASLRTQYPAMFAPEADASGNGASGSSGNSGSSESKAVNSTNGVVSGVDPADVLAGTVSIAL